MSIELIILNTIQNLKPPCAVSNFAAICGMGSPARVSSALNGQRPFDSEDGPLYMNVARKMKALQDAAHPLPIDWSEVVAIKAILAAVSDGSLHISIHRELPVETPEPLYLVHMSGSNGGSLYFTRRRMNELGRRVVEGCFQEVGAARVLKECGDRLVSALIAAGYQAQLVPSRLGENTGINSFEELWG